MPDNEQQQQIYTLPNDGNGWVTGDVITADKMNAIGNVLHNTSAEVVNAINGNIDSNGPNNDILARKLDGMVKYFNSTPTSSDLEYNRLYVQPLPEGQITVPTEAEYLQFKENFVSPFSKANNYAVGAYVEYEDKVYKVLTAIAANASAADDATAWNAITSGSIREINVMQELDNLINVYSSDSQLTQEQNRIWIQQQSSSVQVPTYDEFSELNNAIEKKQYGKNLLDDSKSVSGYLNNGDIQPNTGSLDWKTVPFIDVSGQSAVIFTAYDNDYNTRKSTAMFFLSTFDENGDFVEQKSGYTNKTYTVENGIKFIRFSYHANDLTNVMISAGTTSDLVYYPYDFAAYLHNSPYKSEQEIRNIIDERYDDEYGLNRNPGNDVTGYLGSDGVIQPNTGSLDWKTTDYCYVGDLTRIMETVRIIASNTRSDYNMHFLCAYDENKEFVEQIYTVGSATWDVADGISWVRFCYHSNACDQIMLQDASMAITNEYVPYELIKVLKRKHYHNGGTWKKYRWAAIGDSLTEINIRTTKHYHDYIAESTGINVINMGVSGTGYMKHKEDNIAFFQRAANVPLNADVITIFGSGNDLTLIGNLGNPTDTGTSTICGCVNATIDVIINRIPTAQIGIVSPTPWVGYQPTVDDSANSMAKYVKALQDICKIRSIPFLDLYHNSNLRPWTEEGRTACYSKDEGNGVHPDENGHKLIAPRFKAFLESLLL